MTDRLPATLIYHAWAEEFARLLRTEMPELPLSVAGDVEELKAALPSAEVLICTHLPLNATPLIGNLRWIQLTSAGVEGILPIRTQIAHLAVTNARGVHAELMADHALAAMVMLQWDFPRLLRDQASRQWNRTPKRPLAGRTLCVVGPGAIGGEIGRRASHFGMRVLGVRRSGGSLPGFDAVHQAGELDAVLPSCDFVCVTAPATPETRNLFDERRFRLMKRSAFFLSISRGSLVDEPALIAALQDGTIAGAALDVFEREPPADENPLWTMPNVIMTPHISGMMDTNTERVVGVFLDNLRRYRSGEPLHNKIDLDRGY